MNKKPKKIKRNVKGAPFKIGDHVQVIKTADKTMNKSFIGRRGKVIYFNYGYGCGQTYPTDPIIGVRFRYRSEEEFWKDELIKIELDKFNNIRDRKPCTRCKRRYAPKDEFLCNYCAYRYYLPYFTKKLYIKSEDNEDIY